MKPRRQSPVVPCEIEHSRCGENVLQLIHIHHLGATLAARFTLWGEGPSKSSVHRWFGGFGRLETVKLAHVKRTGLRERERERVDSMIILPFYEIFFT